MRLMARVLLTFVVLGKRPSRAAAPDRRQLHRDITNSVYLYASHSVSYILHDAPYWYLTSIR
jgi:hypothetical protein